MATQTTSGSKPKAYINWILLDEQFKYYSGGFEQVGSSGATTIHVRNNLTVNKSGYLYIYTSNEATNIDVFFDNLQVTHNRGPLVEETHYYPFGLTMAGISSKALAFGKPENKKNKFQDQELNDDLGVNYYEFKWRHHDPQIGRFIQIDPISDKFVYNSTYAFSENKVTNHIELEGLEAAPVGLVNLLRYREIAVRIGTDFSNSMTDRNGWNTGMVNNPLIIQRQITNLQKGESSDEKAGVILHRTVSSTSESTLNSFESRGVGTHFLVGPDGAIYQTASLNTKTSHLRESQLTNDNLSNANTIGIEVVGNYNAETKEWDPVTTEQAKSVAFLVNSLITTYGLTNDNIYNHEDVQPKTAGEGRTVYNAILQYLNRRNNADQQNTNQSTTDTTNQQRGF
jgi:RHS repeat-associated protein